MKKTIALLIIGVAVLLATMSAQAQAIMPAFPTNFVGTVFFNQVATWGTSYNTNLLWQDGFTIDTGVATETGQSIHDRIVGSYDIKSFAFGAHAEFTGVGSAFDSAGIHGRYYFLKKYDFKLGAELNADYEIARSTATGKTVFGFEPGLTAAKAITVNTYATASYTFPVLTSGKNSGSGKFYLAAGCTF